MLRGPLAFWAALALAGCAALSCPAPARAQSPYVWKAGPPSDPNWFMLGVWYQSYSTTRLNEYQSIGLTNYICPSLPTNTDLANLKARGMKLSADYNSSISTMANQGVVDGWNQMDEPDNAQQDGNYPDPNHVVYGPCVNPNVIIDRYNTMKAADPNRPVYLGLGQGVCFDYNSPYNGRGSGSSWSQYPLYCQGGDIIAFDVYPYNDSGLTPYQKPWYVAIGVDRLRAWTNYSKPIWVHIETTHINGSGKGGPKPYQTVAEVWMALVHGAVGVDYFSHSWVDGFHEDGMFSTDPNVVDPNMAGALAALDARIKSYAPVLYSATVKSMLDPNLNVNYTVKADLTKTTVFAVAMRDSNTITGTIPLNDMPHSMTVTVADEGRTLTMTDGNFTDAFPSLANHIYTVPMPMPATKFNSVSGNWTDGNFWTAKEPNSGIRAIVTNGGTATINQAGKPYALFVILGLGVNQVGKVNMTGGSLWTSQGYVGYDGNGVFTQSGGGHRVDGNLYLGQSFASYGSYSLSDGNLSVGSNEYLGIRGRAGFTQTKGAHTVGSSLYVGVDANGIGAYTMQDGNLIVALSECVGAGGTGTFTQIRGQHRTDGNLYLGQLLGSSGTYQLTDGNLTVNQSEYLGVRGRGIFTQAKGVNLVKSSLYLGVDANGIGTYTLQDGNLIVLLSEYVGSSGTGTFTQSGGSHRVDGNLFVGSASGGPGTLTQSGGLLTLAGKMRIGATGVVNLQGGSLVSASGDSNRLTIEDDGQFHITGGSWTVGSVTAIDANLRRGAVRVDAGAALSLPSIRQHEADVNGTLTITGGPGTPSSLDSLLIGGESNSAGLCVLRGGNLLAGEIDVGGSSTAKGGVGSFTVSGGGAAVDGKLVIWSGSEAHLGAGTLVDSDGNHPYLDVENSGTLYIEDGVYCLGRVQGIGGTCTGTIVVESGATLWVESFQQDGLIVQAGGTLRLASDDYDLFLSLATQNQSLVPEPGTLALLALGAVALVRRRRRADRMG